MIVNKPFCVGYIEPTLPATEPIDDEITMAVKQAFKTCIPGIWPGVTKDGKPYEFDEHHAFRGFHNCSCGAHSTNQDYLLRVGFITNALLPHYVSCHRQEIIDHHPEEWKKIKFIAHCTTSGVRPEAPHSLRASVQAGYQYILANPDLVRDMTDLFNDKQTPPASRTLTRSMV